MLKVNEKQCVFRLLLKAAVLADWQVQRNICMYGMYVWHVISHLNSLNNRVRTNLGTDTEQLPIHCRLNWPICSCRSAPIWEQSGVSNAGMPNAQNAEQAYG